MPKEAYGHPDHQTTLWHRRCPRRGGHVPDPGAGTALGRRRPPAWRRRGRRCLIVRDTRESGPMLESALAAGVAAAGADALLGGVLPTPAAAILVRRLGFDLAAVVSASHNPYADNGIKFFGPGGSSSTTRPRRGSRPLVASRAARRPGRPHARAEGGHEDYLRALRVGLPPRPRRPPRRARLRQRRHPSRRAGGLRAAGAEVTDRRRARRPQHQRGLRLHPPRERRAGGRQPAGRDRLRLRRRRRPRAGGRRRRTRLRR